VYGIWLGYSLLNVGFDSFSISAGEVFSVTIGVIVLYAANNLKTH